MVRKLVVAVDDSAVSKSTLQWAAEKLLRPDDELHIISVLEPASGGNFASTAETAYPVSMQECKPDPLALERAQAFLKKCREEAQKQGVADVKLATLVTCVGGAADTGRHIVDYSRRQDADVVLMGSRGMGSLRRAMLGLLGLGSVSSYVVKHANCNVMVHKVPMPHE
ncbi:hypothetical protein ACKKBG_A18530 [Auxenochlorella protothecoides x Auxenochlorella symbiontica]